jgi:hypothetical protein
MDYCTNCSARNVKPKIHKNVILQSFVRDENTFRLFGNRVLRRMSCIILYTLQNLIKLIKKG